MRLIDADAFRASICESCLKHGGVCYARPDIDGYECSRVMPIDRAPTIDAEPVRHGTWILTAHKESTNYGWHVTAECSECKHEKGEIYAAYFPGFPDALARDILMDNAQSVKLDNYCPHCGAKMNGGAGCGTA